MPGRDVPARAVRGSASEGSAFKIVSSYPRERDKVRHDLKSGVETLPATRAGDGCMSSQQTSTKAKETLKALRDMLEKAEDTVHKELAKAAPAVSKSLDGSLEKAEKGFRETMKTIDTRTEKEQLGLLTAYRKFLSGQSNYVDSRIDELQKRSQEQPSR